MYRLHTKEDLLEILINTPVSYIEGRSDICIGLNRVGDGCFSEIVEYIRSKNLHVECQHRLMVLSEPNKVFPHIRSILLFIQSQLKA